MALWNDELYVTFDKSRVVDLYDVVSLAFVMNITIKKLDQPWDIVAGEDAVYVSENEDRLIHRVQLPEETHSNWPVDSGKVAMSITLDGNLMVLSCSSDKITEYTSKGCALCKIRINIKDFRIDPFINSMTMENEQVILRINYLDVKIDRSCAAAAKHNGDLPESVAGQRDMTSHLAVSQNDSVMIFFKRSTGYVHCSPSFHFVRKLIPKHIGSNYPCRTISQEPIRRLYLISDMDSCRISPNYSTTRCSQLNGADASFMQEMF